jgi:hypothetical protein
LDLILPLSSLHFATLKKAYPMTVLSKTPRFLVLFFSFCFPFYMFLSAQEIMEWGEVPATDLKMTAWQSDRT